jgi:hypothetical protein
VATRQQLYEQQNPRQVANTTIAQDKTQATHRHFSIKKASSTKYRQYKPPRQNTGNISLLDSDRYRFATMEAVEMWNASLG